jgi:uncharacterized protein YkwD
MLIESNFINKISRSENLSGGYHSSNHLQGGSKNDKTNLDDDDDDEEDDIVIDDNDELKIDFDKPVDENYEGEEIESLGIMLQSSFHEDTSFEKKVFGKELILEYKIDTNKINSYMLESLNKFRKDYGKSSVTEDNNLTKSSKLYAKSLSKEFKHDYDRTDKTSEVIAKLNFIMFTKVDLKKYDINKVIADCCFDIFIRSYGHMSILLDENAKYFGFGLYQTSNYFMICIRCK